MVMARETAAWARRTSFSIEGKVKTFELAAEDISGLFIKSLQLRESKVFEKVGKFRCIRAVVSDRRVLKFFTGTLSLTFKHVLAISKLKDVSIIHTGSSFIDIKSRVRVLINNILFNIN
jgi:hypothetical protein